MATVRFGLPKIHPDEKQIGPHLWLNIAGRNVGYVLLVVRVLPAVSSSQGTCLSLSLSFL